MPLRTAFKLCPHAVFLPVDYETYSAASEKFKSVLLACTPLMENAGIDEAFLDISELPETLECIAATIKDGIKEKTGLTCSIGIAGNKLLAKIASDMQKPNGLTIIAEGDIENKIWPLPIRKLYGIGPKTEGHLKSMGIETIRQLAALPTDTLIEHFGESYGQYLYEASRGIDESEIITYWEPKSISRETTFQEDVRNWQVIARTLAELTKDVVADLQDEGYAARTVTIKIRFSDFQTLTRAKTMADYTDSEEEIRKTAFACLKRIDLNKRVRLIGVKATNLEKVQS